MRESEGRVASHRVVTSAVLCLFTLELLTEGHTHTHAHICVILPTVVPPSSRDKVGRLTVGCHCDGHILLIELVADAQDMLPRHGYPSQLFCFWT